MSRTIAFILIICLASQTLVKFGIVAWYEVNKDYISKNLCENRDKPQLKCCGKCYLKKKLGKVEDNGAQTKHLPNKMEKLETMECVVPQSFTIQKVFFADRPEHRSRRAVFYKGAFLSAVFHPPSVVC